MHEQRREGWGHECKEDTHQVIIVPPEPAPPSPQHPPPQSCLTEVCLVVHGGLTRLSERIQPTTPRWDPRHVRC